MGKALEGGSLVTDFSGRMNYCDVQKLFDTLMPSGEFRCCWKARYLTDLTDEMIDLAMQNAKSAPSGNTLSSRTLLCERDPRSL